MIFMFSLSANFIHNELFFETWFLTEYTEWKYQNLIDRGIYLIDTQGTRGKSRMNVY